MACKTFHKGKYYVTFKRGFEDCKRDITVTIDKVFESDCLKILLSDDEDPSFLCILIVSRMDYEDLKKQQGLLIDFDHFPSQLVRLLQQCAANNMFLIMHQTNPIQFYFEVVEHNEFKKLVHLSLRTGPATDSDIKQHMANTINNLKMSLSTLKNSSSNTETLLTDKCKNMEHKIHDLTLALKKMEEDRFRREAEFQDMLSQEKEKLLQERIQWQKNTDINMKTQLTASQENLARKDRQIDELNCACKQLRDNIMLLENKLSEKAQRLSILETEVQKTHIEVASLKAKNASLDRDVSDREKQCSLLNSRCLQLEKTIRDDTDTIKELTNSLQLTKKEKISLEERLALSETLVTKNNEAAHSSSEQLLKANQIISKQNKDLIEIKEKLLCRTAIALEQEKVIDQNSKEIDELKLEVNSTKQIVDKLRSEIEVLKDKCENNEQALKDRDETIKNNNMVIQWLHKKMENNCAPSDTMPDKFVNGATTSTPYFLERNNTNLSEGVSDESINFYATTKSSTSLEPPTPQPTSIQRSGKSGLDPKYLQPSAYDVQKNNINKDTGRVQSTDTQKQKGKENKNIELPKVDYREKKSSRGNTYRATPVSAYFP